MAHAVEMPAGIHSPPVRSFGRSPRKNDLTPIRSLRHRNVQSNSEKRAEVKPRRAWGLLALFLLGLAVFMVGVLDFFGGRYLPTLGALLAGGFLISGSGLLLFDTPASGVLRHERRQVLWFCGTFGFGLAALGFAISPITGWIWPGLLFLLGGIGLLAWSPQALRGD